MIKYCEILNQEKKFVIAKQLLRSFDFDWSKCV